MIKNNLQELSEMAVGRLLWKYSLPAVAGMLVMQLYNVVDRIFIGQVVGPEAIAGLAITFPVMNIATALGVLVGAGAAARVSLFLGADRPDQARRVLGNSMVLTLVIGFIYIGLFALFMKPILTLFGADDATMPYAYEFMIYILPGLLLTNITFSFNNIMRASGFPTRAMVTMFIGAGLNIILAPTFIYVLRTGIKGAAIATDISMAVSGVFVMWHFFRSQNGPVTFRRGIYRIDPKLVWGMLGIGAAPFIVNVASCLINIFINRSLVGYGGVNALASAGIFVTYTSMLVCIVLGICQGMQPVIGFNYGAGLYARVRRTFWLAAAAGTAVTFVGWVGAMLVPEFVARAFVADTSLADFAGGCLRTACVLFFMVGFQIISTTFFQAMGKIGMSIFLSLTRQVLFFMPLLYILPHFFGLNGIWATFATSDFFATAVTVAMVIYCFRQLKKQEAAEAASPKA